MTDHPAGSFHVRHDLTPGVARDTLLLLRQEDAPDGTSLLERARSRDFGVGHLSSPDKVLASLRDLGFVERVTGRGATVLSLSPLGRSIAAIASRDTLLFAELVHLRYWLSWSETAGGSAFGWAYRTLCTTLWDAAPARVEPDRLTATVLATAEERFGLRGISFSRSSVLGVLHWLRALSPPCIVDGHFIRRPSASPEAFLVALRAASGASRISSASSLRLQAYHRDEVCRSLQLDPVAFEEMLERAEEGYGLVRLRDGGAERVLIPSEDSLTGLALQGSA